MTVTMTCGSYEMFDSLAEQYDAWYDTPRGRWLFTAEVGCLRPFVDRLGEPRLEIGVGTGRFAEELGVSQGVDPAPRPLAIAASRGVETECTAGEDLPYDDDSFGGILIVFTLCFVDDASGVLREANRVLRPDGDLVLGVIPRDTQWADEYSRRGREGHPLYSAAHFFSIVEIENLLTTAGFQVAGFRSTLFTAPHEISDAVERQRVEEVRSGLVAGAGFVTLSARKAKSLSLGVSE